MHAGLGEEPVKSLLLLNERNGAAEYLRVVVRQVNALPTFHTDKTIRCRNGPCTERAVKVAVPR
jgi:hypothetical protein